MNVARVCRHDVVTIDPSADLVTAAALMRGQHVGYLIVTEPGPFEGSLQPVGVLTDRDIVISVVARRADPAGLRVGEVMTAHPVVVAETDPLDHALAALRRAGVRRVPVVGNRGQLEGVLSLDDILDALSGQLADVAGSIRNEQHIEGVLRP